jgi:hypothetical protein
MEGKGKDQKDNDDISSEDFSLYQIPGGPKTV